MKIDEINREIKTEQKYDEGMVARMNAYYNMLKNFTRVSTPDKDALSDLVVKAKGPRRSMRQFATELDVNPSTLSRIVNKKTQGANTDKLIADIAAKADPDSGVTFEMLMEAHGMQKIGQHSFVYDASQYENATRNIIMNELLKRRYTIELTEVAKMRGVGVAYRPDFVIKTTALDNKKSDTTWAFECALLMSRPESHMTWYPISRRLATITSILYVGDRPYDKISIVINNEAIYREFKHRMSMESGLKIRDVISIILVNLEEECVIEEYVIPTEKDIGNPDIFYELPETPAEDGEDDLDWDSENWEDSE